jgi:hypothetical protein
MRIQLSPTQPTQGNVLLITLLTCVIVGFGLASYLVLVSSQNQSVMRSLAWNSGVPILEAGVEEALTHLKYHEVTQLNRNGWQPVNGCYVKELQVDRSTCIVAIEPTDPTPVIWATAFVPAPLNLATRSGTFQAQLGPSLNVGATTELHGSLQIGPVLDESLFLGKGYIKRKIRVPTTRDYTFIKAMVAEFDINLNGRRVSSDSFDSTDPLHSTNGKYDPAKSLDNGDIATNSGLIDSLNVGNAKIKGKVSTGPDGSVDIGPNGAVGTKTWVDSGTTGIQPGHVSDDMNVEFPPVILESTPTLIPGSYQDPNGIFYNFHLNQAGGQYIVSKLSGKVLVSAPNTVLLVTDDVALTGGEDCIKLAPGASVKMYVAAPRAVIGGQGVINDGNAADFMYYGLESNKLLKFAGNGSFTGVIYAPQTYFDLVGSGKDSAQDFTGASITKTVTMNGNFNFHYDEALKKKGPFNGYIPTSWDEI